MTICTKSDRIVLTIYIRVNVKINYFTKNRFCVFTVFRGTTSLNIMYSCSSRVSNDNVEVSVSYVKVQLNITQFILAAVFSRIRFFLNNSIQINFILSSYCCGLNNISYVVVSTSHYKLCLWDISGETERGM